MRPPIAILVPILLLTQFSLAQHTVERGFEIQKAASDPLTRFPMFATFDDRGRLFIAESSGLDLYDELKKQTRRCRISLLEDRDNDGIFDHSHIFADKLVFPMGLAWRDGKLYVADPPELVTLEDTNNDGVADKRTKILDGFGHEDNGSLHGLIFGPDGLLYMTMGQPDGYRLKRKDGSIIESKTGALIRCRPDGSDPEVLARGFENLVEIAFLPDGQMIGTDNWFYYPAGGVRDALVHLVDGGLYPRYRDIGTPQVVTGEFLGPLAVFPAVALSGIARYEGTQFPREFQGHLFTAQHNSRKVGRHVLKRQGATWTADSFDFVSSEDPDFHPSDVLEDADGSLLVIDTGGWYVQHCPTGQIRDSKAPGGIYRVRAKNAPRSIDPRGLQLKWTGATADELARRLLDSRPAVCEQAADHLVALGDAAIAPIAELQDVHAKIRGLWVLSRIGTQPAMRAIRAALSSPDPLIIATACRCAAVLRDTSAAPQLHLLLKNPRIDLQMAAAEALIRCGTTDSIRSLADALAQRPERFLEHALIHALYRTAPANTLAEFLKNPNPNLQKTGLILLDQPPHQKLRPADIIPRLASDDAPLRQTALSILRDHRDWAPQAIDFLKTRATAAGLQSAELAALAETFVALANEKRIADLLAGLLANPNLPPDRRLWIIQIMAQAPQPKSLDAWLAALTPALADPQLKLAAIRLIGALNTPKLDDRLSLIASGASESPEARAEALRVLIARRPNLDPPALDFLLSLFPGGTPSLRLTAAETLARSHQEGPSLIRTLETLSKDPLAGPDLLLPLISRITDPKSADVASKFLQRALDRGWSPDEARLTEPLAAIKRFAPDAAQQLLDRIRKSLDQRQNRLANLAPLLQGGDPARGRDVFLSQSVSCATCHRIGNEGGQVGPDLNRVGAIRSGRDLLESIVFPSSTIAQGYDNYIITTKSKDHFSGIISQRTPDSILLRDASGAQTRIPQSNIASMRRDTLSLMPQGLDAALTPDQFRDLLAYLQSLK